MFIPRSNSQDGYQIGKSLRFRSSASARLTWTPSSSSPSRTTWTYSCWVKRGKFASSGQQVLNSGTDGNNQTYIGFDTDDSLIFQRLSGGSVQSQRKTSALYRDAAAHYHILVVYDSTNGTAADRIKVYVNGAQISSFSASTNPALNDVTSFNFNSQHRIGANVDASAFFDGIVSEVYMVDGQALDPSYFGQTDPVSGSWRPKKYAGTYGTNGFYLSFSDGTSTTTLGNDGSTNNNDWTLNNISLTAGTTYDWMSDTPTNNFPVLSPITVSSEREGTNADANLGVTQNTSTVGAVYAFSTMALSTEKVYVEATAVSGISSAAANLATFGVASLDDATSVSTVAQYVSDARRFQDTSIGSFGATYTSGDVIGAAIDPVNKTVQFFKNNVSQGTVTWTGTYSTLYIIVSANGSTAGNRVWAINFGQRPFSYTPPSGYAAMCTKNLLTPTIRRGNDAFSANTRTGTGAAFSVTGKRFTPSIVITKGRSGATDWAWYDSVRGATKQLESNTVAAETTEATGLTSFNSDGFSGGALAQMNTNAATYVDYMLREGPQYGLDIVAHSGDNNASRTVSHNLGVVPSMIITKAKSSGNGWIIKHKGLDTGKILVFDIQAQFAASGTGGGGLSDLSSSSSFGFINGSVDLANVNKTGTDYISYLFAEINGYSKVGSYTGNGSADGPFIWCGFRPRFILAKRIDSTSDWWLIDAVRNTYNLSDLVVYPDLPNAEGTGACPFDILSNGFKARSATYNVNAAKYVFIAFAETPFKYSNAR